MIFKLVKICGSKANWVSSMDFSTIRKKSLDKNAYYGLVLLTLEMVLNKVGLQSR